MITDDQQQIAKRSRVLATQTDETVIAMCQRGAPRPDPAEAAELLRSVAPLLQALTRYQLALLTAVIEDDPLTA